MTTYCGGFTTTGHGSSSACGQPVWGPDSELFQCDKCKIAELQSMLEWHPIDTAPLDGSWVELKGGEPDSPPDDGRSYPFVVAWWDANWPGWWFCWWDSNWRSGYIDPTHWRPIRS